MKLNIIFSMIAFVFSIITNAQRDNHYYYYNGKKVSLVTNTQFLTIVTTENFRKSSLNNFGFKEFSLENLEGSVPAKKIAKLEFKSIPTITDYRKKVSQLKTINGIVSVGTFYSRGQNVEPIGTSHIFYVKLKNNNDYHILEQFATSTNTKIVGQIPYVPLWYIIEVVNSSQDAVSMSNRFYESNLFADVDPAFMFNFRNNCSNDPNFGSLWGLYNSSNNNIDINACDAWNITKGEGIKVAVLDTGIDLQHQDLISNISSYSYDCQTDTSPSVIRGSHGVHVAGTIGAVKDNNLQVVGVSPKSTLVSISHSFSTIPNVSAHLASGIGWAVQNGVEVINNSWGDQGGRLYNNLHSSVLESVINNAIVTGRNNKGTVIVFSSGNYGAVMDYPATINDKIITVGAINSIGKRSIFNSIQSSGYGQKLDIVAPGSNILSTLPNNQVGYYNGTSMAAPHVSGVAALMLSVNPNLTVQQVSDIIEQTAQKVGNYNYSNHSNRPNGTWNNEMGYGLVNAHKAVLKALELSKTDLVIKDNPTDTGAEPNNVEYFWESTDIWIRNYNDGGTQHQNPVYKAGNLPNFIKVRVTNKGGVASTGFEKLKLYWAKASAALSYPDPWHGGVYQSNNPNPAALMGNLLDSVYIPILQPNEETIVTIPWVVPDPQTYIDETDPNNSANLYDRWHFCLLARIEADNDPMHTVETTSLATNVRNNNNIAQKNVTVSNASNRFYGGQVAVGNPFDFPSVYHIHFKDIKLGDSYLTDEAEIHVKLSDTVYNAWKNGGFEGVDIARGRLPQTIVLNSRDAKLQNLQFAANQIGTIDLQVHFLTQAVTDNVYSMVVEQLDSKGALFGGETFVINRNPRGLFYAKADNQEVNKNETVVLTADDINESAVYNWYDSEGNLVHQGADFSTSVAIAKTYKLEIIATEDGYKDYKEVEVSLKPDHLVTIYPNPLTSNTTISYKINNASNAYLSIVGVYGSNVSNNYILDVNENQTTIDMSSYPAGIYTVSLIANGSVVDQMNVSKQ